MNRLPRREALAATTAMLTGGCLESITPPSESSTQRLPAGEAPMPGNCELSGSWPSYQHDPQNTGYQSDQTGPAELITATQVLPEMGVSELSPVGTDRYTVHSLPGGLVTVDRQSRSVAWRKQFSAQPTSTPTLGCRTAFVQSARKLRAIDLRDGDVLWETDDNASLSDPNVELFEDTLYYSTAGAVAARDARTGERLWSTRVERERELYLYHGLAVTEEFVIATAGADDGWSAVVAFDRIEGTIRWVAGEIRSYAPPSVYDGRVFVLDKAGRLLALSLDDGSMDWTYSFDGSTSRATPTVHPDAGLVYVPTGGDGRIDAVDIESGDREWFAKIFHYAMYSPIATQDRVYYGGNRLHAYDAMTGEELWTDENRATIESPLALLDGNLYVNSGDGLRYW